MTQPTKPEYRRIQLTRGQFAIIDLEDAEQLNSYCWQANWSNLAQDYIPVRSEYANGRTHSISMAREIMNAKDGEIVDHINGDPKDARRENLRIVNSMKSAWNRKMRRDSGQLYKGVIRFKSKWYAGICVDGKQIREGPFSTPEEARDEYGRMSADLHGEFGCIATEKRISDVVHAPILERARKRKTGPIVARQEVKQPENGAIRHIPLTQSQIAIIDASRYVELSAHSWYAVWAPNTGSYYAARSAFVDGKWITIRMHTVVAGSKQGQAVDHKNHNTLDNRLENLRIANDSQSRSNRRLRKDSKSGFKGVGFAAGKWMACIQANGKRKTIGRYSTAELAYEAYCKAALELHGEFACLK